MSLTLVVLFVGALALAGFALGRWRALAAAGGNWSALHSLPGYYGWYAALAVGIPGLLVVLVWTLVSSWALDRVTLAGAPGEILGQTQAEVHLFLNEVHNVASGGITTRGDDPVVVDAARRYSEARSTGLTLAGLLAVALCLAGGAVALRGIRPNLAARVAVERALRWGLMASSTLAILVTVGIVLSLIFETFRFFQHVGIHEFLFGIHWSPQTALRADQVGSSRSSQAFPRWSTASSPPSWWRPGCPGPGRSSVSTWPRRVPWRRGS
jgi:phosphate transport system permease protein